MAGYLVQVMTLIQRGPRPAAELRVECMPADMASPRGALRAICLECPGGCRCRHALSETTHQDSGPMVAKSSAGALIVKDVIDQPRKGKAA